MARASLTAAQLHAKYAQLLSQPPFSEATSAYHLHKALTGRQPPIAVSEAAVKQWWCTHRVTVDAAPLKSAQELEDKYGQTVRELAVAHPTAFRLVQVLRKRDPPIPSMLNRCS